MNFCILRTREINPFPLMLTPARLWPFLAWLSDPDLHQGPEPFLQPAQGLGVSVAVSACVLTCARAVRGRTRRQKAAPAKSKGRGITVGPGKPGERTLGAPAAARIPTRTGLKETQRVSDRKIIQHKS